MFYLFGKHDTSNCQGNVKTSYDLCSEGEGAGVRFVPLTKSLKTESGPSLSHSAHVPSHVGVVFVLRYMENYVSLVRLL